MGGRGGKEVLKGQNTVLCAVFLGVAEVSKAGISDNFPAGRCLKVWPNVTLLGVTYGAQLFLNSSHVEHHYSSSTSPNPSRTWIHLGSLVKMQSLPQWVPAPSDPSATALGTGPHGPLPASNPPPELRASPE